MEKMSLYMVTSSFISLAVAALLYIWHTATKNEDVGKSATIIAWLGGAFLTFGLVSRTIASGHGPFSNMYEYSVSFAWGIVVSYVAFERQLKSKSLGVLVLPIALLLLLYSSTLPADIEPLVPALQNNLLLTIHVAVAIFAYGMFSVSFGSAVMYLIQADGQKVSWMPDANTLDDVSYKSVILGVPLFALVIILGAVWGNVAWGRYWGWDPKETASLVTWLIYLGYLHARSVSGWKGKPSAVLLVIGFVATLFTFFGVNLFLSGLHSYAGLG
ncbi:MAG: c-type cytochrome biogenesis protein CcsB [Chloroflexi bacterium]|nr:c-type cytochrome biogenesis protein CcsB [Chloroflexota bacterium]MDA8188216.1 c-type cytochrome biogenesis protein CcsB [Dehalococcoidales bacterium]